MRGGTWARLTGRHGRVFRRQNDLSLPPMEMAVVSGAPGVAQDPDQTPRITQGRLPWDKQSGSSHPLTLNDAGASPGPIIDELERVAIADPRVDPGSVKATRKPDGTRRLSFTPLAALRGFLEVSYWEKSFLSYTKARLTCCTKTPPLTARKGVNPPGRGKPRRGAVFSLITEVFGQVKDDADADRAWVLAFLDSTLDPNSELAVAEWFHFIDTMPMDEALGIRANRTDSDVWLPKGGFCYDGRFLRDKGTETLCDGTWDCDGSRLRDRFKPARGTV